jgi:hypothetical protein
MKIINDTEIWDANECYFAATSSESNDITIIAITNMDTWNEGKYLSDNIGDHFFEDGVIPDGMDCVMKACWETNLTPKQAETAMLAAGFIKNKDIEQYLKTHY